MINKELKQKSVAKCVDIWHRLKNECDGTYVGAEDEIEFEFDGKAYKLICICFWDRSNYFDYKLQCDGETYKSNCVFVD